MTWAPGLPVAALLLVACGSDAASPSALERGIADGLRTSLRPANLRVRCGPAPVTACLATADGIDLVVLVERDVKLGERWRLAEPVVTTVPIADYVTRELAALGVTTAVDCGPSLVPALAGGVAHVLDDRALLVGHDRGGLVAQAGQPGDRIAPPGGDGRGAVQLAARIRMQRADLGRRVGRVIGVQGDQGVDVAAVEGVEPGPGDPFGGEHAASVPPAAPVG